MLPIQMAPTRYTCTCSIKSSHSIARFVLNIFSVNLTNVFQDALLLALNNTITNTPVVGIQLHRRWYYRKAALIDSLRSTEMVRLSLDDTFMIFDQKSSSVNASLNSIYTTLFIIFLLVVSNNLAPNFYLYDVYI